MLEGYVYVFVMMPKCQENSGFDQRGQAPAPLNSLREFFASEGISSQVALARLTLRTASLRPTVFIVAVITFIASTSTSDIAFDQGPG